jgi:peroxiredoxin
MGSHPGEIMLRNGLFILLAMGGLASVSFSAGVPEDPAKVVPLTVGTAMPATLVRNADGSERQLGPGPLSRPLLLIFYRGGWCPYCNRHLGELKKIEPKLLQLGYELLFLSTDRPEILYSSLKEPDVHYTLLSDSAMNAAHAYQVAFRVDQATLAKYKEYGVDLQQTTGQSQPELPVPAVFLIDKQGVIRFVHANPDFTTRISPEDLLAAAQANARTPKDP